MLITPVEIRLRERAIPHNGTVKWNVKINLIIDVFAVGVVGRKLQSTVAAELGVIIVAIRECDTDMDWTYADLLAVFPPDPYCLVRLRQKLWLINDQKRRAV